MPTSSLRYTLRDATHASHEKLDAVMSRFDLADRQGYGCFIAVHAAVLLPLETAMEQAGVANLLPDWPERARRDAIAKDAAALSLSIELATLPPLDLTPAGLAGIFYVLEGSRLGNAMVVREARAAPEPLPGAFMEHGHGKSLWPSFVKWLDGLDLDEAATCQASRSAQGLFGIYQQQAERPIPTA